ncbi:MAG: DUF2339 domain-containing protein [Akkermansiaceae bacterium]|jgi:uncharacterized membrane protein|tara:strand:- start:7519 stop:10410 length:2892 start_codon:yes stop_codon:yes gene_type:complete
MEDNLRAKLDALLRKQEEMQDYLHQLGEECKQIDQELSKLPNKENSSNAEGASNDLKNLADTIDPANPRSTPPPIPPQVKVIDETAISKATPTNQKQTEEDHAVDELPSAFSGEAMSAVVAPKEKEAPLKLPPVNAGEWELNFGKVWLVRIGVLLLLTGLIFLSTYAYKNWLFMAGPAAKVTFFMTISLTLTGLGMWLDKWKERFRQYGRVVASGGLAAGYYTIYASHFVPSLQLVDSAILAGILLTLWAGLMLAYAVWKKSRVVAVMAIGLAFYGTIVNPSGWLSLFSALLLSSAGMWLMIKFRWIAIGLGTVVAAYVAHAFWLGFYPQSTPDSVRFTYLAAYWLLFTAALTVPKARKMPEQIQRAFCAINNGAAWCLAVFIVPKMIPHNEIGWISIGVGALLVAIAIVARTGKIWDKSLAVIFGYQGILIASLGILLESTGYTRFLVMAVEACILMAGARYFGGWLARVVSSGAFLAAMFTALPDLNGGELASWQSYAALALVSAVYTALVRQDGKITAPDRGDQPDVVPLFPAFLTWIIAVTGVFSQWTYASGINGMMITAVVLMLSYFFIKYPRWKEWTGDVAMLSIFTCIAGAFWYLNGHNELSILQSLIPLATIATFWLMSPQLTRAWEENLESKNKPNNKVLEWLMSILFWLVTAATLFHHVEEPSTWLFLGGLIAIIGHGTAEYLRRPSIGTPALLFHLVAVVTVATLGNSEPALGWLPAIMLLLHLALTDLLWKVFDKNLIRPLLALGVVLTVGTHAFQEFDRPELTLTALGLILSAWAYHRKDHSFAITGGAPPLFIACISAISMNGNQDWPRYVPILATLMMHGLLWRGTKMNEKWIENWKPVRVILLVVGLASLFYASTVHVQASFDGAGVAICWALVATALFCAGLTMRCRPYRLIAMWWLAAAVLHVVFIDVMKLDTLGRILSFISLGLVLLTLGFLYNKFQETIRKFL